MIFTNSANLLNKITRPQIGVQKIKRILVFFLGLFFMALGVALSVKANLGVSPISCVPYVYSLSFPLTLGQWTIVFNALFVVLQMVILRSKYNFFQLIQLLIVFVFGYFIDMNMRLVAGLTPGSYIQQIILCLFAAAVLAFGVFLLVKTHLTYLPLDGFVMALASVLKIEFGKVKVSVDSSMVVVGVISSFVFLHHLYGIREGSIIASLLIGTLVRFYSVKLPFVEKWLRR